MKLSSTTLAKGKKISKGKVLAISALLLGCHQAAFASNIGGGTNNMEAIQSLQNLQSAISGPILSAIAVIMIVVTSLMLAFGEWGDGFKRLIQIVFWVSIAAGAGAMVSTFMG